MSSVAIIPVMGRIPLLPHTISQALKVVDKVLCITSKVYEREFCIGADTASINRRAKLGDKWNWGFQLARDYNPDYVLFIGSSDWVTPNWMDVMTRHDADIVGVRGFHLLHLWYYIRLADRFELERKRSKAGVCDIPVTFTGLNVMRWRGYRNERRGEPIGIGRVLNRDFLNRIDFKPFYDDADRGLDGQMFDKAKSFKTVSPGNAKCLSISTNLWINLHKFGGDTVKDGFIDKYFPEALELTKWTNVKLTNYDLWNVKSVL